MVTVREADPGDLAEIVEIDNASILTTTTWSDRFQTIEERAAWFEARRAADDGVLVAHRPRRRSTHHMRRDDEPRVVIDP